MFFRVALTMACICFCLVSLSAGADTQTTQMKDQPVLPVHLAPVYGFGGLEAVSGEGVAAMKMNLGPQSTASPGMVIGTTTYDLQHNSTMGRQIAHGNDDFLYFVWTYKDNDILGGPRDVYQARYNLFGCAYGSGAPINLSRAGFCGVDIYQSVYSVPTAHESYAGTNPHVYWDNSYPGAPGWNNMTGEPVITDFIWPKIDADYDGAELIIHLVATLPANTGDPDIFSYFRRIGPYGAGLGLWSSGSMVDTGMSINITVVSSPISDKVALVWNAPADYRRDTPDEFNSQYENDIWYAIANDNGASWETLVGSSIGQTVDLGIGNGYDPNIGGNLTTYSPSYLYKAFCDISALWSVKDTPNDYLQIVWGCRQWDGETTLYRRNSAMFHWSQKTDDINTIAFSSWDNGGACYAHAWGSDLAKMTISECDGRLYVVYTQFGSADDPCGDVDGLNFVLNGEVYVSMSDDDGATWGTPVNLTNSATPNCAPGDCDSDYWASAARYGRIDQCEYPGQPVLDILYINDKSAGSAVQPASGYWTTNNVMWMTTPCYGGGSGPTYICGDANDDGDVNVADVVYLINYIFKGGPEPVPQLCVGDVNDDGDVNVADCVYLISYIFKGGPEPIEGCCG
jgi:hypothetical protein